MRTPFLIVLIFTLFFSIPSYAKTIKGKEKVDKVSEYFMSQLVSGEVEAAYSLISAYIGVDLTQFEERGRKTAFDLKQIQDSQGKALSYALLKKQSVGEHFYKITYLMKYKAAALVWEMNYYQPDDGWKLVDINFHADINKLFE